MEAKEKKGAEKPVGDNIWVSFLRRRIFLDTSVVAGWLLLVGREIRGGSQKLLTRWRFVEKLIKSKHTPVLSPIVISETARAVLDSAKIWKLVDMGIPPAYFFRLQKDARLAEVEKNQVYTAFWQQIDRLLKSAEIVQDFINPDHVFRLMLQTDLRTVDAILVLTAIDAGCEAFVTSDRDLISALSDTDLGISIEHVSNAYNLLGD